MNLSLDLDGPKASIRVTGYLSVQAGKNLAVLLEDLGRLGSSIIELDLSDCSPVCVGALEVLLGSKFELFGKGVEVGFLHPPSTVSKTFEIMGLAADGEPMRRSGPNPSGQPIVC